MNTRATKNMWVVRCSHIGAMVGSLLSILFCGIWKLIKWVASNMFVIVAMLIAFSMAVGFCAKLYSSYQESKVATPDAVKQLLSKSDQSACVKNYFPVYTAYKTKDDAGFILTVKDLNRMVQECKKAEEAETNKKILEEQLKAAK